MCVVCVCVWCVWVCMCVFCVYIYVCAVLGYFVIWITFNIIFFTPITISVHGFAASWMLSVSRVSQHPSACRIPKHADFVASPTLISVPGYTATPIPDTVTIPGFATGIELVLKGKLRLCCDLGRLKVESNLLLYWVSVVFFKKDINKKNFACVDALNSLPIIFLVLKWLFQWPWPMACFGVSDT